MEPNTTSPSIVPAQPSRKVWLVLGVFALLLLGLWQFPGYWYTNAAQPGSFTWFAEQTNLTGWTFKSVPVAQAAEAILMADRTLNGSFSRPNSPDIRVFSAKRYLKKENEIGLFSHTPDRCWTAGGWTLEATTPDFVEVAVHGVKIAFERRLFRGGQQRELVYFGALVGGKPLPYRLDQHYQASLQRTDVGRGDERGTWGRLRQGRYWGWVWEAFVKRTPFGGPQQFIRISMPVTSDIEKADQELRQFLDQWLQPADYATELALWRQVGPPTEHTPAANPPEHGH